MKYMVIIDGSGETNSDFSVLVVEAETPRKALTRVIGPDMGYGRQEDGTAYVVRLAAVSSFTINDTTKRSAEPMSFEEIVSRMSPTMRQYLDVDGGHPKK